MNCPYCASPDNFVYYRATMPNILSACPASMLDRVGIFPFEASLCQECLLGFNSSRLSDSELKSIYDNYLYISPKRGIGRTKYGPMVETLSRVFSKTDSLVEVGCSEGYLLGELREAGFTDLMGVEPGPQAEDAKRAGFKVVRRYLDDDILADRRVDGFYLMHVFEHFPDPFSVLRMMSRQMAQDGKIVIEVPDFDGYHHQHLFFYSPLFMSRLAADLDLKLVSIEIGMKALRIVLARNEDSTLQEVSAEQSVSEMFSLAEERGSELAERVERAARILREGAYGTVVWWGAGSTSVILLNQIHTDLLSEIDLIIVDGDEQKWGCVVPGVGIEVQPFTSLSGRAVSKVIIASSFPGEIKETIRCYSISAAKTHVL